MFRFQVAIDRQPRSKKGRPAHRTTGVESPNWSQEFHEPSSIGPSPGRCPPMAMTKTGIVKIAAIQNRRVMSISSGFSLGPAMISAGSSAMPQLGQAAGFGLQTSGHMGQI